MSRVIYWFRTDLRLHDSPALKAALDLNPACLYPVWTWDPHYVFEQRVGSNRWQFLLDSMNDVNRSITTINANSKLHVVRGAPITVLPILFQAWSITHIVWEKDDDPYTKVRDEQVARLAEEAGVQVLIKLGHTIWDSARLLKANKGKVLTRYGPFVKLAESQGLPPRPIDAPKSLPDPGETSIALDANAELQRVESVDRFKLNDVNYETRRGEDDSYAYMAGPKGDFAVPTMEELNMKPATSPHRGGETRALEKLEAFLKDKQAVLQFEKPKTDPASFDPASTTILSPHLKFGCLSPRLFYYRLLDLLEGEKHTSPPVSLIGQLYWREFFHFNMAGTPNWHQVMGNPICRFIDWRLPNEYDAKGQQLPESERTSDEEGQALFESWKHGRTGFPWIDAVMRQLKTEGWIHHLARHSVACFLTRGHLYISWERGQEVFDQYLIDWDPAMNGGNWMWLSCSAFFSQYYHVYSPITFGKKYHAENFIRKFVPEMKDMPDKYLYEPWTAPSDVQKEARCVIGQDYPAPIIDERNAKLDAIERIKAAYEANLYGDSPEVRDGSAFKQFRQKRPLHTGFIEGVKRSAPNDNEGEPSKQTAKKPRGSKDAEGSGSLKQTKLIL